jgi:hypothetical protein
MIGSKEFMEGVTDNLLITYCFHENSNKKRNK